MIAYVQYFLLEALSVTSIARQHEVGHKLHLNRYDACSLTFFASSALGIEREVLWGVAHLLREGLFGKEFAYLVVSLDVGGRVGAGAFSDGILVDKLHVTHLIAVARQAQILSWHVCHLV